VTALICVSTPDHQRHVVPDSGYQEVPARMDAIAEGLSALAVEHLAPEHFADRHVTAVHDPRLVRYLRQACAAIDDGRYEYADVFPLRHADRPPRAWARAVGYYCTDSFTPVHRHAYAAARDSVDAALTGAAALTRGRRLVYALVRPPGHHAERGAFGGYCYLNSSAAAAHYLTRRGRVAMLDVDYHHGNGQQNIFYRRGDVLTVSIHAEPAVAYPHFAGFADERGEGEGEGANVNLPLREVQDGASYRRALRRALAVVREFDPDYLVVPLGFDTARHDPEGSFLLDAADFRANGQLISGLGLPTLFVQEGGYRLPTLGHNAGAFFRGVLDVSG